MHCKHCVTRFSVLFGWKTRHTYISNIDVLSLRPKTLPFWKFVLWLQLKLSIVPQYQRIPTRWQHYVEGFSYNTRIRLNLFFHFCYCSISKNNSHQMAALCKIVLLSHSCFYHFYNQFPPDGTNSPAQSLAQTDTKRRHNCFFPRSGVCSRVAPYHGVSPKNCIFFPLVSFFFVVSFSINCKTIRKSSITCLAEFCFYVMI